MAFMSFTKTVLKNLFSEPVTTQYPAVPKEYPARTRGHIENDKDKCILCGMCMRSCPPGAIKVDRAAGTWSINRFDCVQCGYCTEKCPKKCLSLVPGYQTPGPKKYIDVVNVPVPAKPAARPAAAGAAARPAAPAAGAAGAANAAAKPKFTPEQIAAMRAANLAKKAAADAAKTGAAAPAAAPAAPAAEAVKPAAPAASEAPAANAAPAAAKPKFTPEQIAAMRAANLAKRAAAEAAKKSEE